MYNTHIHIYMYICIYAYTYVFKGVENLTPLAGSYSQPRILLPLGCSFALERWAQARCQEWGPGGACSGVSGLEVKGV